VRVVLSKVLWTLVLLGPLSVQGCSRVRAISRDDGQPTRVSMIQLLASPKEFEGRRIAVQGFVQLGNEERALYLTREDAEYFNTANSLWLDASSPIGDALSGFVSVEGTFTAAAHGHMGLWLGTIERIARVERIKSRAEYPREMVKP
jgi:hypothetical protein